MQKKFLHFQPEYVRKFICDGSACNAHCCRKSWTITIDKNIYKKYSHLKKNKVVQDFMKYIKFDEKLGSYILDKGGGNSCPVLGEDNLCSLQKNYGLDYLSVTCQTYPRNIYKINGMYEWSLTASCPVVAKLALLSEEPMIFEEIDLPLPLNTNIKARSHNVPPEFIKYVVQIQFAAISILQDRRLTIDQRLLVLGFFLIQLEEIQDYSKIPALVETYTDENFIPQNLETILSGIVFNAKDFVKIIFGEIFPSIYTFDKRHQKYLDAVIKTLWIETDSEGAVKIDKVAENYLRFTESRQKFVHQFSYIFENYLVNEFFTSLYPFTLKESISTNFAIFIAIYKMVELFVFSVKCDDQDEIVAVISELLETIDHSDVYLEKIAQVVNQKNIFLIMKSFLQV